jgi:hypothetical protein
VSDEVTLSEPSPPARPDRRSVGIHRHRIGVAVVLGVLVTMMLGLAGREPEPVQLSAAESAVVDPERVGGLTAFREWSRARADAPGDGDEETIAAPGDAEMVPTAVFARVDGLVLRMPATDPVVAGFHEASTSVAIEMTPVGRLVENHNTTKFAPPVADPIGASYLVMASRGRVSAATSALDVVLPDELPVLAPVTGVVSDVRTYWLYGAHEDHRIEIVPDDAPHLRVVLVHVEGVEVATGDRVEVGSSVLARSVNRFPFSSQIDREVEPRRLGHVHLEVQPVDARRPGD